MSSATYVPAVGAYMHLYNQAGESVHPNVMTMPLIPLLATDNTLNDFTPRWELAAIEMAEVDFGVTDDITFDYIWALSKEDMLAFLELNPEP